MVWGAAIGRLPDTPHKALCYRGRAPIRKAVFAHVMHDQGLCGSRIVFDTRAVCAAIRALSVKLRCPYPVDTCLERAADALGAQFLAIAALGFAGIDDLAGGVVGARFVRIAAVSDEFAIFILIVTLNIVLGLKSRYLAGHINT